MGVDWGIQVPTGLLIAVWRLILPPIVQFSSPTQRAKVQEEHVSWWHVPVTARPRLIWRRLRIGPQTVPVGYVHLEIEEPSDTPTILRMCFGDAAAQKTISTTGLRFGDVFLIPVVRRDENDPHMRAEITDERYFSQNQQVNKYFEPDREKRRMRLLFRVGNKRHYSDWYILRVPTIASNGQFTLECEYEGLGTRARRRE